MKILVGVPCGSETCQVDFMMCLAGVMRASSALPEMNICLGKSSIVAMSRNNIVAEALRGGYSHIMFFDNDMVFPNNTVLRLLAHQRPIVGATYRRRRPRYEVLGEPLAGPGQVSGLVEMRYLPTGVMLVETAVFARLERPWFRFAMDTTRGYIISEDYLFCIDARKAGYALFCDCDLSQEIGHITQATIMTSDDSIGPGFGATGIVEDTLAARTERIDA